MARMTREWQTGRGLGRLLSAAVGLLVLSATSRAAEGTIRFDFESGDLQGWQVVDGKFDPAKYAQVLDDPATYRNPNMKQFVLSVEYQTRQNLLQRRLQEVVAGGVRVTAAEVRSAYLDENEKVTVGYVGIDATGFADSLVNVSDTEAQAYYDAHLDEDRVPGQPHHLYDRRGAPDDVRGCCGPGGR